MSVDDDRYHILYFIDTKQFIHEVEKRPILYDVNMANYDDKNMREASWNEVCSSVDRDWNKLSEAEKEKNKRQIQKKWKNLRDCFKRELAFQRKESTGEMKRKKKKYMYYDSMAFLLPFISKSDSPEVNDIPENNQSQPVPPELKEKPPENMRTPRPMAVKKTKEDPFEAQLLKILKEKQKEDINEDKCFALSLVPMLAKLNDDQKHFAKINILNGIRDARLGVQPLRRLTSPQQSVTPIIKEVYCEFQQHKDKEHITSDIHQQEDQAEGSHQIPSDMYIKMEEEFLKDNSSSSIIDSD